MISKDEGKVVPIWRAILASDQAQEIANLAFGLRWANEFRAGPPEEDLFVSVRQWRSTFRGSSPEEAVFVSVRQWRDTAGVKIFLSQAINSGRSRH